MSAGLRLWIGSRRSIRRIGIIGMRGRGTVWYIILRGRRRRVSFSRVAPALPTARVHGNVLRRGREKVA
jgi:hypothetical protein